MDTDLDLSSRPTSLGRHLALVSVRERGLGPAQLRWIGSDPEIFEAFYLEHVERDAERDREDRWRGSALLDSDDSARIDAHLDAAARSRDLYAAMAHLPEAERARRSRRRAERKGEGVPPEGLELVRQAGEAPLGLG